MKNNFKNLDKERLREISSRGGKVKSPRKKLAAKQRFRKRVKKYICGDRQDNMIQGIIKVLKYYNKPLCINC